MPTARWCPRSTRCKSIESHDGGMLYAISRGEGSAIVFSHGVTLSSRVFAKQFDWITKDRFRAVAFDAHGHGESMAGESGHSVENLGEDIRSVVETSISMTRSSSVIRWGAWPSRLRSSATPTSRRRGVNGIVLQVDGPAQPDERRRRPRRARWNGFGRRPDVGSVHPPKEPRPPARPRRLRRGSVSVPRRSHAPDARGLLAGGECATQGHYWVGPHRAAAEIDVPTLVVVGTARHHHTGRDEPYWRSRSRTRGSRRSRVLGTC